MRIPEDPHTMALPPRGKSSPIVDSSNTRSLTTIDRRSMKPASDKLPPKAPPSRRHSTSTPNSHFLSEFNVEACFDFRSIPDPPTPEPRNRRRLSSPMLPNMAQSHDRLSEGSTTNDSLLLDSENLTRASSKRARKSLCHVPSPAVTEQRDDPTLSDSPPPVARKILQVNICLDEDEDDDVSSSSNKRRKKRQSMEMPREWVQEHDVKASFEPPRASPGRNNKGDQNHAFAGDMQDMKDLQALVRGYCKVPKEERGKCQAAIAIEQSTGYPLVAPEITEHPLSHANRRSVFQKMGPIIEEIDKRKAEEIAKWEYETACRVERSAKSGKYRYVSIETNTKVGSQEYMRRYMGVLAREASLRLAKANEWKGKLYASKGQPQHAAVNEHEDYEPLAYDAPLVTDSSSDMEDGDNGFAATQELDLDLNEILALNTQPSEETEQESVPPGAEEEGEMSMELCDMSVSMDLGDSSSADIRIEFESSVDLPSKPSGQEGEGELNDEGEEALEELSIPEPSPEDCACCDEQPRKVVPKSVSPTEMELLPLPDREEESADPDIARAERRLWCRIDAALQDYSHEIMMIMQSKSTGSERGAQ